MVTIGVLALQGDVDGHIRALERSGARALRVCRADELEQIEGLVIPGRESTIISKLLTSFGLFDPLAQRIRSGLPVWGTCVGVIMLASNILDGREDQRSFGAFDMVVRHNVFGRQFDSYEEDLQIRGVEGDPFHAVFIHAPWVESLGESVGVLVRVDNNEDGPIIAVRKGPFMACSSHPELGGDDRMHALFTSIVEESTRWGSWISTRD